MPKSTSKNIFEYSSKPSKFSKKGSEGGTSKKKSVEKIDDAELEAQVRRVKVMHQDLLDKMDKVYEGMGVTPREVEKMIEDPSICSDEDREKLESRVGKWSKKLFNILGSEAETEHKKEKAKKKVKKRNRKTLASRKGWMQM